MSFELDFLQEAGTVFAEARQVESEVRGGLIAVWLDDWPRWRDALGYAGLFSVREQLGELCVSLLEDGGRLLCLRESLLVLLVPFGQRPDELADILHERLPKHAFSVDGHSASFTFSLASCHFDAQFLSSDAALLGLVAQLEQAVEKGRGCKIVVESTISAGRAAGDDRQMLKLLMESLKDDRIETVFQSLLPTGHTDTMNRQMLPRLRADDGRLITAGDFIPVAERAGVLPALDRWMVTRALELVCVTYRDQPVRLFVSQSVAMLKEPKRREAFERSLQRFEPINSRLVMDYRLPDAMLQLDGAIEMARMLTRNGVRICYSMVDEDSRWDLLGKDLPVDFVRMSPRFVQRLVAGELNTKRFKSLVAPLREQGGRVILPMVEDPKMAAALWAAGADYLQGNLIEEVSDQLTLSA